MVIVKVPLGLRVVLPPKIFLVLLATLPNTALVAYSWLPLMASVLVAEIAPEPTFLI